MKKNILISVIVTLAAFSGRVHAQQYTYKLGNDPGRSLEFAVTSSDVIIEGHDSDEVIIHNLDYEAPPKRAEGLRALYHSAEDNTGIGLFVEEEDGALKVIPASRNSGEFKLLVPDRIRVLVEEVNWGGGDFELKNLQGEIEIKSKTADVKLTDVTGPIVASSTSGDMEIVMSSLSQAGPTSISLISGFIDITMPAESKANLSLSSMSGEIYTDMDVDFQRSESNGAMKRVMENRWVKGTLNGGGVELDLKTISGDIYLRKR